MTGLGYTVIEESFPRFAVNVSASITSATPRVIAIPVTSGVAISRLTFIVGDTAEAGGTNGWYAILDNTFKVQAVTVNQVGATVWSPVRTPITLTFTAPWTPGYTGVAYAVICVSATTLPTIEQFGFQSSSSTGAIQQTPLLSGLANIQSTPPALGSTLAGVGAAVNLLYCCYG